MGFEVDYPTFGRKTKVVAVLADVPGYSVQYWSMDKQLYCGIFAVMKSDGMPSDPQGLGRNATVIAAKGEMHLSTWVEREGACAQDLAPIFNWFATHPLKGHFFGSVSRDRG